MGAKFLDRGDGTYEILHNVLGELWQNAPEHATNVWLPYRVVPRESGPVDPSNPNGAQWPPELIAPGNAYDLNEIRAYAQAHPEDQVDTFETVEDVRREALRRLQQPSDGAGVVTWEGIRSQTSPGIIAKLVEYRTAINAGEPGPFLFRDADNVNHQLSPEQVSALHNALSTEVNRAWADYFKLKDAIRAATSLQELASLVPQEHRHPVMSA